MWEVQSICERYKPYIVSQTSQREAGLVRLLSEVAKQYNLVAKTLNCEIVVAKKVIPFCSAISNSF